MATEVNAQLRQNSTGLSESLSKQRLDSSKAVEGQTFATQRQELQVEQQVQSTQSVNLADDEQLDQTVEDLSTLVKNFNRELNFTIDEDSGRTVIKVIDGETDEVIRQIPSEEVVELAQMIDQHAGLLMKETV